MRCRRGCAETLRGERPLRGIEVKAVILTFNHSGSPVAKNKSLGHTDGNMEFGKGCSTRKETLEEGTCNAP